MIESEDDILTGKSRKSSRPKAYKDLDDNQYRRCILREQMIAMSYSQPADFMSYLEENKERIFKAGYSTTDMDMIARSIRFNRRGYNSPWEEDVLITSIFGPPKKAVPTYPECQMQRYTERPRTPKQEIEYRKDCTFETFYDWVMGRGLESIKDKLDADDWDRLDYIVDDVCMRDIGLPKQKHYEEGDERMLRARMQELKA